MPEYETLWPVYDYPGKEEGKEPIKTGEGASNEALGPLVAIYQGASGWILCFQDKQILISNRQYIGFL